MIRFDKYKNIFYNELYQNKLKKHSQIIKTNVKKYQ